MYPVSTKGAISKPLKTLTSKGTPTFTEASKPNVFPFVDTSSYGTAPQWGVVQVGNVREIKISISRIGLALYPCNIDSFVLTPW